MVFSFYTACGSSFNSDKTQHMYSNRKAPPTQEVVYFSRVSRALRFNHQPQEDLLGIFGYHQYTAEDIQFQDKSVQEATVWGFWLHTKLHPGRLKKTHKQLSRRKEKQEGGDEEHVEGNKECKHNLNLPYTTPNLLLRVQDYCVSIPLQVKD